MDRDKLIARLRGVFLSELHEHVRVFNRELLALEKQPDGPAAAESIRTLFRTVHSLKGASRSVNATKLEGVCHRLEESLAAVRDGRRSLTPELIATLFAAVDTFEATGREFSAAEAAQPTAASPAKPAAGGPSLPPRPPPPAIESLPPPAPAPVAKPVEAQPIAPAPPQPPAAEAAPLPAASELAGRNLATDTLVRVPGRRLDGLLAQSGELLIARRRLDARRSELSELQDFVSSVQVGWRSADNYLTRSLAARERNGKHLVRQLRWESTSVPRQVAHALQATRDHLQRLERDIERLCTGMADDIRTLDRAAGAVERQIYQVRMLPFSQACEGLYRAVRDLARDQNKQVELQVEGNEVEIDRAIIDALRDPLLHMVRNAIDHGIETPEQRTAAGKPANARLVVSASLRTELVEVTVRDDGRGIDPQLVHAAAKRRGMSEAMQTIDPLRLIFEPGFSTASVVNEVSGRGVGLDVVKTELEAMRGSVEVSSELGRGTLFTLWLPLTVSTLRVLFVRVGSEVYALPSASVRQLVRAGPDRIRTIDNREVLLLGAAAPIPIVALSELIGAPVGPPPAAELRVPLVVTAQLNQVIALAVDELLSEQDVVCKPLGKRIGRLQHVSAATILSTGRVALLLKPSDLVRVGASRAPARRNLLGAVSAAGARKRLLLVDDSATIRTLESSILEAAGHDVLVAVDGSHAWQLLQEKGADLVVSDVEMPNMDGFALTQAIRSSKRFRDLPVILLTSLDRAEDRARGLESGASAYLVKSAFDQTNLLETIRQLL